MIPQNPEQWATFIAEVQGALDSGRDAVLSRMGYASYNDYLASRKWKKIKERILAAGKGKCFRCNGEATEVHHRCYSEAVLNGENDDQLRALCQGCHHIVEFDDDGTWRKHADKERLLFQKDRRTGFPKPIETKTIQRRGKQRLLAIAPSDWLRMNARQRKAWTRAAQHIMFGATLRPPR